MPDQEKDKDKDRDKDRDRDRDRDRERDKEKASVAVATEAPVCQAGQGLVAIGRTSVYAVVTVGVTIRYRTGTG